MYTLAKQRWILRAAFLVLLLTIVATGVSCKQSTDPTPVQQGASQPAVVYTCTMHPQIRESKPGKCPICGMNLVPAKQADSNSEK
jgi:hypothetical protein